MLSAHSCTLAPPTIQLTHSPPLAASLSSPFSRARSSPTGTTSPPQQSRILTSRNYGTGRTARSTMPCSPAKAPRGRMLACSETFTVWSKTFTVWETTSCTVPHVACTVPHVACTQTGRTEIHANALPAESMIRLMGNGRWWDLRLHAAVGGCFGLNLCWLNA